MILGIGTDIVEVHRIRTFFERFGQRFVERILLPSEIEYCLSHKDPGPFLAVRFAAKEAVSKAFGTGIGRHLGWHDIEVQRRDSGEPFVVLHDKALSLLEFRRGGKLHITLSHTAQYATATAVLEAAL
jgi:holo-[acyl-carrier protein] synthase